MEIGIDMNKEKVEELLWEYTEGTGMVPYWQIRNFLIRKGFTVVEEKEESDCYGTYYYIVLVKDNLLVHVEGSQAHGETELATGYWEVEEV